MTNPEIPPIEIEKEPLFSWGGDTLANREESSFDDEKALKAQKTKNDLAWLKLYGNLVYYFTIFFSLLFCILMTILFIHYVTPWGWLSEEKLSKIQTIVFSGSIGTIVSTIVSKQVSKS